MRVLRGELSGAAPFERGLNPTWNAAQVKRAVKSRVRIALEKAVWIQHTVTSTLQQCADVVAAISLRNSEVTSNLLQFSHSFYEEASESPLHVNPPLCLSQVDCARLEDWHIDSGDRRRLSGGVIVSDSTADASKKNGDHEYTTWEQRRASKFPEKDLSRLPQPPEPHLFGESYDKKERLIAALSPLVDTHTPHLPPSEAEIRMREWMARLHNGTASAETIAPTPVPLSELAFEESAETLVLGA